MTNETEYIIAQRYYFITRQLTVYGGIILFILCLFGTLMNIITFSQRTYHPRASSFYLLVASLFDLAHLTPVFISDILRYGFYYDWSIDSTMLCKIKSYVVYVFIVVSGTLSALASIDRFILSSSNPKWWKYSSHSTAKRCITFTILFWCAVSIPIIVCTKHSSYLLGKDKMICFNPSDNIFCLFVRILYICFFEGVAPSLIMMVFSLITCKNARHLHRRSRLKALLTRRINYQLISMLVLQSMKSTFASFPYSIYNIYWLFSMKKEKSILVLAKENLVMQIVYLLFWSNYTSFFVYLYSSDIFRDQWMKAMKKLICCLYGNRQRRYSYSTQLKRLKTTHL